MLRPLVATSYNKYPFVDISKNIVSHARTLPLSVAGIQRNKKGKENNCKCQIGTLLPQVQHQGLSPFAFKSLFLSYFFLNETCDML